MSSRIMCNSDSGLWPAKYLSGVSSPPVRRWKFSRPNDSIASIASASTVTKLESGGLRAVKYELIAWKSAFSEESALVHLVGSSNSAAIAKDDWRANDRHVRSNRKMLLEVIVFAREWSFQD